MIVYFNNSLHCYIATKHCMIFFPQIEMKLMYSTLTSFLSYACIFMKFYSIFIHR